MTIIPQRRIEYHCFEESIISYFINAADVAQLATPNTTALKSQLLVTSLMPLV